jgi:SulP family sulfate permease
MHATHKAAPQPAPTPDAGNLWQRLRFYCTPWDGRYEDLAKGRWYMNVFRDFTAGLIVAMVAIPLAMGFAMASGLPPEMGIVGGAVAGLVGALFGGSKYQVYGPTAAFIPVIAAITSKYDGYSFLIWCSLLSGIVLIAMGILRLGRLVAKVPNSIVVGFTIGIACVIAMSQVEQVLGLRASGGHSFLAKLQGILPQVDQVNYYAVALAVMTFVVTKYLLKVSRYIPAPLIALGLATLISATVWSDAGLTLVRDKYGAIPDNLLNFTLPGPIALTPEVIWDLCYFVVAIVFVSGVESLLCSRMADRLADNRGVPYNPNKELWGQGWVQILVPLFNGFPHTGALARTATNIKVGAVSPLAGIFKFALKLLMAIYLAPWLEAGADGLHRRHSHVRGRQHGQAGRGSRSVETEPLSRRPDDLHGRHGADDRLPGRRAVGAGDLRRVVPLPRRGAAAPGPANRRWASAGAPSASRDSQGARRRAGWRSRKTQAGLLGSAPSQQLA